MGNSKNKNKSYIFNIPWHSENHFPTLKRSEHVKERPVQIRSNPAEQTQMLCLHVHLLRSVYSHLSYNRFVQPCSSNSVTRDLPWSSSTVDRQFSSVNSSQSDLQYPWISTETSPILSHLHAMVSQDSQQQNSPFNILPIRSTFLQVSLSFPKFSHFLWVQNHYHVDDIAISASKEKLGVPPLTTMLLCTLVTDPETILP